jgi:hypothetical protein
MKKIILIIIFLVVAGSFAFADVIYVSSAKTGMFSKADRSSEKISNLSKGAGLTVVSTEGSWIKVSFAGKEGFVQKMFTSSEKPGGKVSLLGSADSNARVHARKRASSDVTAASARGLMDDETLKSIKGRSRSSNSVDDSVAEQAISDLEKINISDDELMNFLKGAKLQ